MGRLTPAFSFSLLTSLALGFVLVVQAQQNPGFISIDCGATNAYIEEENNIAYQTDEGFIDSGKNMQISTKVIYQRSLQLVKNLRSFPNGTRNCYTLRPDRGKNNTYLIRASFWYGNYDGTNQTPSFDLYIDVNYWTRVSYSTYIYEEIMYVSQADDIQVCLVNTGNGVPFISALELRTLDDDIYRLGSGFLQSHRRYDIGLSSKTYIRYPIDVYDRIWTAKNYNLLFILNTTSAIDLSEDNDAYKYKVPGDVLRTAQRSKNASLPVDLHWTPSISFSTKKWIVYFYFVEIERLTSGVQREFVISMNDHQFTKTVNLEYLKPVVMVSTPVSGSSITFSIESTNKSGYPPILNAVEFYTVGDLPYVPTAQDDESSKRTLRLKNRPFKYREVSRITGNFGQVIGEGGFGKVYLGTQDNGTVVAVKMLSESSKQGYKEFQAEAQLLMIVHHGNLVSLLGYCDDSKHMALIYEYMANGNLRQHLSVKMQPIEDHLKVLTWSKRLQIAVDAAQGLDYLHNGCKPPIIHRDLKTTNILLDEDFRAKIADFGLSRVFATENDFYVSTCPAGTPGYLDPEFQSSRNLHKKSDVYSFGIILFELITGRPPLMRSRDGSTSMHILQWLIPIVERGDIQSITDPRLQGELDVNSAWKVVEIAMSCTRPTAIQRPDINHVLAELKESLVSKSSGSFEMTSLELHSDNAPVAR